MYCYVAVLLCCSIVVLQYCCVAVLLCCSIVMLQYCCVAVLLCYSIVVLQYCYVAVLLCYSIVVLQYCCVAVLLCCTHSVYAITIPLFPCRCVSYVADWINAKSCYWLAKYSRIRWVGHVVGWGIVEKYIKLINLIFEKGKEIFKNSYIGADE